MVHSVTIENTAFDPASITVQVGDTCEWYWVGTVMYSSTSDDGLWDSGLQREPFVFSHKFDDIGEFQYHCDLHKQMKGLVIVTDYSEAQDDVDMGD